VSVIKRQTILGTIFSYMGVFIGTITQGFFFTKYLEVEEAGLFAMLFNWSMIFVVIIGLGYNYAGTKYFNKFRDENKKHNGYLFNGIITLLLGSFLVIFLMYFFKDQILNSSINDTYLFRKYFNLILPLTISIGVFNLLDNYAKGLYDTVMGNFLNQFFSRFTLFLVVLGYILEFYSFENFVYLWLLSLSFPSFLMLIHTIKLGNFSLKFSSYFLKSNFKFHFFQFALFSIITSLSSIIITKLDSILVYDYLGLKNVGIYNFSLLFGSVMTISYNVNLKASTAIVIDSMEQNDLKKVSEIFTKSSITQVMFGTLLLLLVWINIDLLLGFIKPEYAAAKNVLLIIGIAKLFDLSSGINSLIMAYSKYYKIDSLIVISFIVILLLLNHVLIPKYGLIGAGLAALISTVYYNCIRNILIWKFYKIHPYTIKIIWIILAGLFLSFIGLNLPEFVENIWQIFFTITYRSIFLVSLFVVIVYFLKISPEVNTVIKNLLKKLKFL
jgi:O-antigen/teichoic acid export membrane protein